MKKYLLSMLAFSGIYSLKAQFITTNPANTPISLSAPVNVSGDLTMAAGKIIKFGAFNTIKAFGTGNGAFGENAGNVAHAGQYNGFFGPYAGTNSVAGDFNTMVGYTAGYTINGNFNTGVGRGAFGSNTGNTNSGVGYNAGLNNTGSNNVFLGGSAGINNTGSTNVFIGDGSVGGVNTGVGNVFIGYASGQNNTSGFGNLFLGAYAKSASLPGILRATAIGYQCEVEQNDAIILGKADNGNAKVGIGTATPSEKLHVNGGVRFQGLPTDAPGGTAVQYLVADATGKVYVYTGTAPARIGAPDGTTAGIPSTFSENWTLKNDFLYNKNKKGIIIGEGITSMPKGYGMYVTDGILTEKVKVAIKNSSDWADYVFNKDYKRMTLTEVEKFISVNKHLPNMLSATEMVTEGNDLAKTDAKLLEKIEELTLYMIEMKKENAQMKRQINNLKRKLK